MGEGHSGVQYICSSLAHSGMKEGYKHSRERKRQYIYMCLCASNNNTVFVKVSPVCLKNSLFVSNKHTNGPGKSITSTYTGLLVWAFTQIPPCYWLMTSWRDTASYRPAAVHYTGSSTPHVHRQPTGSAYRVSLQGQPTGSHLQGPTYRVPQKGPCRCSR